MTLRKVGSPHKIQIVKQSAFEFDANLIVKEIVSSWGKKPITIDQIHEATKAMGIINYSSEDMNTLIELLKSSGVNVKES